MKKILVIGSLNMDFVADVSHIPTVGETILAENFELVRWERCQSVLCHWENARKRGDARDGRTGYIWRKIV